MKRIVIVFAVLLLFGAQIGHSQAVRIAYTDTTTMQAPANSTAQAIGGRYSRVAWFFQVIDIVTSVGVALQIKAGEGQWTSVWADSLVYKANGNYALEWDATVLADSIRFKWISESGATTALIRHNAILYGGN